MIDVDFLIGALAVVIAAFSLLGVIMLAAAFTALLERRKLAKYLEKERRKEPTVEPVNGSCKSSVSLQPSSERS